MRTPSAQADRAGRPRTERETRLYDRDVFARMWQFVRPHRRLLYAALVLLPITAVLRLMPPYLLKLAIDEAIVPGALAKLPPYALVLVLVLIAQQLSTFGEALLTQICGQRATHDIRVATHRHALGLRAAFFDRTPVGRVMTRVTNDVESIAEAFSSGLISLVADLLMLIGIVGVMLWLDAKLALLTFAVLPVLLLMVLTFQRWLRQAYRLIRRRLARINATLQEQINGVKVVQLFARERRAAADFDVVNREFRDGYKRSIKYDAALFSLVEMLGSLTVALLLWYGGLSVVKGAVTFGLLVAFIEYVGKFFIPIRDLSAKYAVMQQAMAAAERVFDLLDTDEPDSPRGALAAGPVRAAPDEPAAAVEFRDVSFCYDPDTPVLRGLSFVVERGQNVAVVGATGAGKSTIVRLLTRLYDIDGGSIELAGVDVRTLDPADLRRRVVVLSQDVYLFAGDVRTNITLGDPRFSAAEIEQAAARLGLQHLLALDHPVAERGANLSAGERQLVVFARALLRDPELLILDEATANVDPESERIVQAGIAELIRQRTAIVIAHRLSTIEQVDRVLVLQHGQLLEQGTHRELLARGGLYSKLYRLQYVEHPAGDPAPAAE